MNKNNITVYQNGLSGATLKYIALVCMLIDHLAQSGILEKPFGIVTGNPLTFSTSPRPVQISIIMVSVGRLAFPIFCFFLVQGCLLTKNPGKHLLNLFLFAIISEIPFDYALNQQITWTHQNVMWTMFLGALLIHITERIQHNNRRLIMTLLFIPISLIATFTHVDYYFFGILLIYLYYFATTCKNPKKATAALSLPGLMFEGVYYPSVYLSTLLLYFYNGERGKQWKWLFYVFYPLHLNLIALAHFYL